MLTRQSDCSKLYINTIESGNKEGYTQKKLC